MILAGCIILSATFMRHVADFFLLHLGGVAGAGLLVWSLFLIIGLSGGIYLFRKLRAKQLLVIGFIVALGILFALNMGDPIERIHLIEFGFLGAFVARDQPRSNSLFKSLVFVVLTGMLVATVDEILQHFIPRRFGDIRDVVFGVIGTFWGGSIYLGARSENYSNRSLNNKYFTAADKQ